MRIASCPRWRQSEAEQLRKINGSYQICKFKIMLPEEGFRFFNRIEDTGNQLVLINGRIATGCVDVDITELTAEIIRSFVEKVEVLKPEKVPGTRTKKQTIIIYGNSIGAVKIPVEAQEKTA